MSQETLGAVVAFLVIVFIVWFPLDSARRLDKNRNDR